MKRLWFWMLGGLMACGSASLAEVPQPPARSDVVEKTDAQWRESLSAEEYRILRKKGTERAFTGKLWNHKDKGAYHCAGCGLKLFSSEHKFRSGTGWPSYTQPVAGLRVSEVVDATLGMRRTEIVCSRCGGHLGHVFEDGPPPTGLRYCVNGNALDFQATVKP